MTHFGGSQRDERRGGSRTLVLRSWGQRARRLHADADQEGVGQEDERQMAVPAQVTADFILIQSQGFAGLQVLVG
jgi:hypothetical protein